MAVLLGMRHSVVFGCGIGLLLALANFYISLTLSSKALTTSFIKSEIIILFGFLLRLTALGFIFYGLSKIDALNIIAVLITFLICFSLFLVLEVRVLSRGGEVVGGKESYSRSS